jgi:hypothetical protein
VARLQANTAWLAFAPVRPGGVAAAELSLANLGSAPAGPPRWSIDGPFRLGRVGAGCQGPLPPGAQCTLEVLFEPTAPGAASGRLRFGGTHGVALRGEAVGEPLPLLSWQAAGGAPTVPAPSHGTAAVGGAPLHSALWTLVNRGDAATAPLTLALAGSEARDFSLDAASSCRAGLVLAPRQACSVRIDFHPSAAGPRRATLRLQGGAAFAELPLEGRGRAEALGLLQARPEALWFDASAATAGSGSAPGGLYWHNGGPAALRVSSLGLRGDGFATRGGGSCPAAPFLLQPGQSCTSEVAWNGTTDARFGAEFVARTDDGAPLAVPLAVVEDPALRSNVGGSGGGGFGAAWVLLLAVAAAALRGKAWRDA